MHKDNIVILEYFANLDGKHETSVFEKFEFDENRQIIKSSAFYRSKEIIETN